MPQIFPISLTLPAPNWIDDFKPGNVPFVSQTLSNNTISRLRISEVQSNAEFVASWNAITYAQVQTFLSFWRLVGSWDSFTLPLSFWDVGMPAEKRAMIIDSSPTGYWMFADAPKLDDYNLSDQAITATFRGVIN